MSALLFYVDAKADLRLFLFGSCGKTLVAPGREVDREINAKR
jgi:hypothetical protein